MAVNNGFSQNTQLGLLLGGPGRQPPVQELRVGVLRLYQLRQGPRDLLLNILDLVGLKFWNEYGSNPTNVKAKDPLVAMAKQFGHGSSPGGDVSGAASGRIADRHWKLRLLEDR